MLKLDRFQVGYRAGFRIAPQTFTLSPGVHRICGGNGAGKSTLLRGIVGELAPLSGHCVLGERDTWRQIEARTSIGYAPSEPEISAHLTVGEALQFHASLRNAPDWPWRKMLSEIGLPSTLLLSEASAGQRKRAELACALAGDPDLLVLDEPFEHLDSLAKEWLAGALDTLRTERIIVMTHHGDSPLRFDSERDVNG